MLPSARRRQYPDALPSVTPLPAFSWPYNGDCATAYFGNGVDVPVASVVAIVSRKGLPVGCSANGSGGK